MNTNVKYDIFDGIELLNDGDVDGVKIESNSDVVNVFGVKSNDGQQQVVWQIPCSEEHYNRVKGNGSLIKCVGVSLGIKGQRVGNGNTCIFLTVKSDDIARRAPKVVVGEIQKMLDGFTGSHWTEETFGQIQQLIDDLKSVGEAVINIGRVNGVIAELICLEQLGDEIGIDNAVEAWVGPSGSTQDFVTGQGVIECKSMQLANSAKRTVKLSSEEQLLSDKDPLGLFVATIEEDDAGECVKDVETRITQRLIEAGVSVDEFNNKLNACKDLLKDDIDDYRFSITNVNVFNINEVFQNDWIKRINHGKEVGTESKVIGLNCEYWQMNKFADLSAWFNK